MFYLTKKYSTLTLIIVCLSGGNPIGFAAEIDHKHEAGETAPYYYCPMHPQIVSDKPGICPICHMKLVLNTRTGLSGESSVNGLMPVPMSESARNLAGIHTDTVRKSPIKKRIQGWGEIAHDPELYQLQIDFLRQDRLNYERGRDRTPLAQKRELSGREKVEIEFLHMGLSPEWIQALEEAGVPDRRLLFHHNADGMWVYVRFREKDTPFLKKNDAISIRVSSLANLILDGRIEFIDSLIDEETRTVRTRILIKNIPQNLKANMTVSATVEVDLGEALVIPEDAPLFTGERVVVFVDENGVFRPREVTLGVRSEGNYEVKEGLMDGEKVASSGNFFIDSESRLRSAFSDASHKGHAS